MALVGIATRYGLDGLGFEPQWGREFPQPTSHALGPTQPPVHCIPDISRGKASEARRHHPSTTSAEFKERVELYFSPSVLSWHVTE
jgi:hypothetical protein